MTARSIMSYGSESLDIFTRRSVPKIDILLAGQKPGLVSSYTTSDRIEGHVTVKVDTDTRFDEVEIIFQGSSHAIVERAACPGRTGSQQMFLKLRQPIEESEYPCPRILEAGRTYSYPFTFVVPDRLLPQACTHPRSSIHIHHAHTTLPPTLGDPMLAGNGKTLLDDMAPSMCQVSYTVRAAVLKKPVGDQGELKTLANTAKKVRIIPAIAEEPPINVADHTVYITQKEKLVKRGFLRGKLGRLVASASQPSPIRLLPLGRAADNTVTTVARIHLRFDPVGGEQPPKLGSLSSKIRVSTHFGAGPWEDFPTQKTSTHQGQVGQGLYIDAVPISNMCVASAQWKKHTTQLEPERRSSMLSMISDDSQESTTADAKATYFTTSLVIPISLPKNKAFVPTFHSCLISRIYALDLSLTYHTPGANVLTPTISLRLPIQVITQPDNAPSSKNGASVIVTPEEVEEYFQPRSVAPPTESVVTTNLQAPPGYS
ncbi:Uncharacterized protein PECH_006117 [Penicillium ucsense]|uniref:Arrestin-like N-terminal domain-containing protein n=1 Tax=Penicillium ucsense TaxID=2839758 RepID=A0A8J8WGY0_9EURO|nr:Uncharacterized protein PECM_008201 [Penicillium ucsense]KAF7735866.1 Uncharacterized protein PECH_006117 [Penicillium ucsense]